MSLLGIIWAVVIGEVLAGVFIKIVEHFELKRNETS